MQAIRRILVHVNDNVVSRHALDLAVALARAFGAEVVPLAALAPPVAGAFLSAEAAAVADQLARDQANAARDAARALVAEVGASARTGLELLVAEGDAIEALVMQARTADLVVVAQRGAGVDGGLAAGPIGRLLVGAGCPLLVVPHIGWRSAGADPAAPALQRVLVAWSGTREGARAVRDALPLLAAANQVELASCVFGDDEGAAVPARAALDAAAAHLRRHGIEPTTTLLRGREPSLGERLQRGWIPDVSVAEAMLSHAADIDADFIVMGAYGHARLWELVLGGMTRTMLQSMTVPVLMSH